MVRLARVHRGVLWKIELQEGMGCLWPDVRFCFPRLYGAPSRRAAKCPVNQSDASPLADAVA